MPILNAHALDFFTRSADQTRRIGMRLGAMLKPGDVICLSGDLGSGKTTLVQGIARGWGTLDHVTSPTFILVNIYRRPEGQVLHHLDAYRLDHSNEAEDLDINLMLENGPIVVEWAERIKDVLPENHLWIEMRWMAEEQRGLVLTAQGKRSQDLLDDFRKRVFGGR